MFSGVGALYHREERPCFATACEAVATEHVFRRFIHTQRALLAIHMAIGDQFPWLVVPLSIALGRNRGKQSHHGIEKSGNITGDLLLFGNRGRLLHLLLNTQIQGARLAGCGQKGAQ